jgi:hypothetical protein
VPGLARGLESLARCPVRPVHASTSGHGTQVPEGAWRPARDSRGGGGGARGRSARARGCGARRSLLRPRAACDVLEAGVPITVAGALLGHAHVSSTATHLCIAELDEFAGRDKEATARSYARLKQPAGSPEAAPSN